jgi:hypothetical protein
MVMRHDLEVSIFPNPTSGLININFYNQIDGDFSVKYTDAIGRVIVEEIKVSAGSSSYVSQVLTTLPAGVYFVEVINANGSAILQEKIIKSE